MFEEKHSHPVQREDPLLESPPIPKFPISIFDSISDPQFSFRTAPCPTIHSTKPLGAFFTPYIFVPFTFCNDPHFTPSNSAFRKSTFSKLAPLKSVFFKFAPVKSASFNTLLSNDAPSIRAPRKFALRKLASRRFAPAISASRASAASKFARANLPLGSRTPIKNAEDKFTPTNDTPSAFNSSNASIRPPFPPFPSAELITCHAW